MLNETGVYPSTHKNRVLADYWSPKTAIHEYFEYEYNDQSFEKRVRYLEQHAKDQKRNSSNHSPIYGASWNIEEIK